MSACFPRLLFFFFSHTYSVLCHLIYQQPELLWQRLKAAQLDCHFKCQSTCPVIQSSESSTVFVMDPFSLAASIITVIGATKTGINGIKVLRGASDGLEDLLADISQFEAVLEAIQNLPGARDNADSELKRLLESGSKKVVELNSLVQYRLTKAGESSKVDRLQWIRSGHDVERLRGQLRDIIANLVALVGVNTRYG